MKKVGKTTRPFRYDLNQIPYDYTIKVRNRFKGLDLIDREVLYDAAILLLGMYLKKKKKKTKPTNLKKHVHPNVHSIIYNCQDMTETKV